jgi:CHAD domain-containing protein
VRNDDAPLAGKPIPSGLTELLGEISAAIERECIRFLSVGDAEALHDLRVAMRRLHTLFTGFSPCFSRESDLPERLRSLQKETNTARDLEVTLTLTGTLQLELSPLQQRWQTRLEEEYRRLRDTVPPAWQPLHAELERSQQLLAENPPGMALGAYAAALAAAEEKRLLKKLKRLRNKWGTKRAHKLRIRGKRVRYLLEPFAEESPAAAAAVARLKKFQDRLGDYHDIVIYRERLRTLPEDERRLAQERLKQAERRLKKAQRRLRKSFLRKYRGKRSAKLHAAIDKARHALAQS